MNNKTEEPNPVMVKVSYCKKCSGWVRSAVTHMMSKKSKAEFAVEAMDYDLEIKDMTIDEHAALAKSGKNDICKCE
jgi:hypothetical protein